MGLMPSGVGITLLSTIVAVLMILNLVEVSRLDEDAGVIIDKVLSSYLLALAVSFIAVMLCGWIPMPNPICTGIDVFYQAPVIRHILPVWKLSRGAVTPK